MKTLTQKISDFGQVKSFKTIKGMFAYITKILEGFNNAFGTTYFLSDGLIDLKMFKENYEETKKLKDCAYFKAIGFRKMGVESGISLKDAVENKRIFCMMVLYYDPFSTEKFKVLSVDEYNFSEMVRLITV